MFEGEYFNMQYNAYGSVKLSTFPELPCGEQFPGVFVLQLAFWAIGICHMVCLISPLFFLYYPEYLQTFYFITSIQHNIFSIFFFLSIISFSQHIYRITLIISIFLISRMGNGCRKIVFRSIYTITYLILLWVIEMTPPRKYFSLGISDVFLNIRYFTYFFKCKIY